MYEVWVNVIEKYETGVGGIETEEDSYKVAEFDTFEKAEDFVYEKEKTSKNYNYYEIKKG